MSKYLGPNSAKCAYCRQPLEPIDIILNPEHLYSIGILYQCPCGKASVWTNSIRGNIHGHQELVKKLKGLPSQFYHGFCNDLFCGKNLEHRIDCVKTGHPWTEDENTDLFGCRSCKNYFGYWYEHREPERDPPVILDFYRENIKKLEALFNQVYGLRNPSRSKNKSPKPLLNSYSEMLEHNIKFLKGEITVPWNYGPIDEETIPLLDELIEINKRGFLTMVSQPGSFEEGKVKKGPNRGKVYQIHQRGFVDGLLPKKQAIKLWDRGNRAGLIVIFHKPTPYYDRDDSGIIVTYSRILGKPYKPDTFAGRVGSELYEWEEVVEPQLIEKLEQELFAVCVIDPVWERDGFLTKILEIL